MGKLDINGELDINSYLTAATTLYISSAASTSVIFRNGTTEAARINSSGCLNINSSQTSADYKLYVGGASRFGGHVNPTAANSYYNGTAALPWYQSVARRFYMYDGSNTSSAYAYLQVSTQGTTSTGGVATIAAGNNVATGTAGNAYGQLLLFSSSTGYAYLRATSATTTGTTHYLPETGGTLLNTGNYSSYALPLSGGAMTGNISYANGSYTNYEMIKFITGTNDGAGIVIGGGGLAVFGSGESASNLVTAASLAGNSEETHITSDGTIYFHTNCQTIANRKTVSINANGAFSGTIAWGNVTGKPSSYTPAAHTNHATLTVTSTSATGHLNFSRAGISYITAPASGYIGFSVNGQGSSLAVCDLVVNNAQVYPGSNNATELGTSGYRWSAIHTQRIHCYSTTDVAATAANNTGIIVGSQSGEHIEIDNNEIMCKSNGTTPSTLYLNSEGGTCYMSAATIAGTLYVASNSIIVGASTVGTNTYSSDNPHILFRNDDASQTIKLMFTDYDAVVGPASLTLVGNQGNEHLIVPKLATKNYGTGNPSGNAVAGTVYFKIIN